MEKKIYITPKTKVMELETVEMMATSTLMICGDDEVDTSTSGHQLGNGRRGSWGNLWD